MPALTRAPPPAPAAPQQTCGAASWSDALDHVARGLRAAVAAGGPDAVAAISSARATNEENYLIQKFMRTVIGTNNIENCSRLCHSRSAAGLTASFGLPGGTAQPRTLGVGIRQHANPLPARAGGGRCDP
ncbi:molybdopterin-dependent oxidoreductase [Streptomyces sp. NPDC047985]|uniref:molybdopterin-dependent oxidoreductase n=1 Tax=Streptomyces sp. NPDC047985 TaxID=3155384 RepID=UPI0034314B22